MSSYRQSQAPRTDWFRVLADLAHAGISTRAVSRRLEVAKSTVLGWKQGNEPRHSDGEQLLELWATETGKPRADVPLRKPHAY